MFRPSRTAKITELDAIRGAAASVVFTGHYFANFAPGLTSRIAETPLFFLLNGPAAVVLFFVMSGFVLARRPLERRSATDILIAALKRWPRLAGPVVASSLFYITGTLFNLFPSVHQVLSRTPHFRAIILWGRNLDTGNIHGVLWEALAGTFWLGMAKHNDVLWSMHWELLGSFLAFSMVLVFCIPLPRLLKFAALAALACVGSVHGIYLACFVVGMAGAFLHLRYAKKIRLPTWGAAPIMAIALAIFSVQASPKVNVDLLVMGQTFASAALICVALYHPGIRDALRAPAGALLGRMSFSVYLIHLFVLCSFTSWACVVLNAETPSPAVYLSLYPATAAIVFVLAYALMLFDEWWVGKVNASAYALGGFVRPRRVYRPQS
jgi:peptidoglycan/LPS O-acetylase OafA/YrhL